jgi:hypothetical protein
MFTYTMTVFLTWFRQFCHNAIGIMSVWDIIRWRPLGPGMIPPDHSWCTGAAPDGWPVWGWNVIYSTQRRGGLPSTSTVLEAVGSFLARMVRSAAEGAPGRMPWGIRYLHGAVHYNGGWIVFNDLAEAKAHVLDPRFRRELRFFSRRERRELVIVFREKIVDAEEYANLISLIRCLLPWFSNSNGPGTNVLWGNPSPFPTINMITGNWRGDVGRLRRGLEVCRPAIGAAYFCDVPYGVARNGYRWPELLLKHLTRWRIEVRGPRGNLYFVDRTKARRRGAPQE